jgi:hypothetical protein
MKTGGNDSGMKADALRFPTPGSRSVAVQRPSSSEPDLVVAQGGDQRAYAGLGVVLGFVQDAVFLRGFHHPVFVSAPPRDSHTHQDSNIVGLDTVATREPHLERKIRLMHVNRGTDPFVCCPPVPRKSEIPGLRLP